MGAVKKVLEWGMQRRAVVRVEEGATEGATIGKNVYDSDGSVWNPEEVVTEVIQQIESETPAPTGKYTAIWRFIREIPANIVSLAGLSGIGFATRISSAGEWANRVITGTFGRIEVVNGDGVGSQQIVTLNSGGNVTLNSGGNVTLNALTDGNPVIELGPWPTVQNSIASGLTYVVPEGNQLIVYDSFDVEGTLDIEGDLVIL